MQQFRIPKAEFSSISTALCHNEQTAVLFLNFGFGHVLQYTPFIFNFNALHFTHSYTT